MYDETPIRVCFIISIYIQLLQYVKHANEDYIHNDNPINIVFLLHYILLFLFIFFCFFVITMDLICPYKRHTIITFSSSALSTYNDYITVNVKFVYFKTCEYVFLILKMYLNSCLLGAMIPSIF